MWPPEPDEPDERELQCEGSCAEEGLTIIWFAYGYTEPDEDGTVFIPYPPEEATCPWCNNREEHMVL